MCRFTAAIGEKWSGVIEKVRLQFGQAGGLDKSSLFISTAFDDEIQSANNLGNLPLEQEEQFIPTAQPLQSGFRCGGQMLFDLLWPV
jgi:hypothetical protein